LFLFADFAGRTCAPIEGGCTGAACEIRKGNTLFQKGGSIVIRLARPRIFDCVRLQSIAIDCNRTRPMAVVSGGWGFSTEGNNGNEGKAVLIFFLCCLRCLLFKSGGAELG